MAALVASAAAAGLLSWSAARAQPAHGQADVAEAISPTGETEQVLQEAKGYRSWKKFPRYEHEPVFSKGHKAHVVAWYNEVAGQSVKRGGQRYPDGSVIVKENRPTPDAEPSEISVMAKRGGAWHWVKATPDWKVLTAGGKPIAGPDVAACNGCHTAAENDMVFSQ